MRILKNFYLMQLLAYIFLRHVSSYIIDSEVEINLLTLSLVLQLTSTNG